MMPAQRFSLLAGFVALMMLAACGHNMEQRAATGAAAGLVVAGPVGAVVGAGVGAVVNEAEEDQNDADDKLLQ